jgi:hypothetical protein
MSAVVKSKLPPLMFAVVTFIVVAFTVSIFPVTAVTVEKIPVEAELSPIGVPSIEPPLMST